MVNQLDPLGHLVVRLERASANLDAYIERRAAELAQPLIAKACEDAAIEVKSAQGMQQRAEDLNTELRRQLRPLGRQVDHYKQRAEAAEDAIARVRALHQPEEVTLARGPYPGTGETGTIDYTETCCSACNGGDYSPPERWPCPTIRALDG